MDYGSLFIVPILHPMDDDDKRWSFREEILKLFNASLKVSFPDLEEEASIKTSQTGAPGDYNCQNVLTIWPKLRKSPELREKYSHILEPRHIGEAIKKNLPTYAIDMIDEEHFVQDVGFVPLSISRKWFAKSIHMMLKDGIETWAPKLPMEMVVVNFPTLDEENRVGLFRREAIRVTLHNMLNYSKVATRNYLPTFEVPYYWDEAILKSSFLIEDQVTHVVISGKQTVPFILTKEDFRKSCMDLVALREVTRLETVDWVVVVAPVRQQEYIEMCFTAAKHEKWIRTDRKGKWNPALENEYPIATYAGYRTCSTEQEELVTLLRQVRGHCDSVAQGRDALLLGYSAEKVFCCVLLYTCLKNHRLVDCTFNFNEMVEREGNTFIYLLHSRAEIHRVTNGSRKDINELKKASDLILETYEEWEEGEEHVLEFHLLEFTEVLKESCLSVLPDMMCEYLYDLTKKFNSYNDSVRKVGYVAETSKLLLCEATAVVMDKCFQLLGIDGLFEPQRWDSGLLWSLRISALASGAGEVVVEPDKKKQKIVEIIDIYEETLQDREFVDRFITPSFVSGARDPARNSRFELFSFIPLVRASGGRFEEGKLFGLIAVSDKYGFRPDGGTYLFERDFPYVDLFNFEWCHAIDMSNGRCEFFGNPSSRRSVPFSSSIEIFVELYVTTEKKDACFELSNSKFKIDLSDFWDEKLNSKCGRLIADGKDGRTTMYYIAIKDAVDTTLEVKFNAGEPREVYGNICAYYGDAFSYYGRRDSKGCYMALLFDSKLENGTLSLKKSELAVPSDDVSLIIRATLYDSDTHEMVLANTCEFIRGCSSHCKMVGFEGVSCSLELTVVWQAQ